MRASRFSRMSASTALLVGISFAGSGYVGCSSSSTSAGDGGASSNPDSGIPMDVSGGAEGGTDSGSEGLDAATLDLTCANSEGVTDLTGDLGGNGLDAAFPFSEPGHDFLISAPSDGMGYNPLVGDIDLSFASFVAGQKVRVDLVALTIVGSATTCSAAGCRPGMSVAVGQSPTATIMTTATDCGTSATVPIDSSGVLHLAITGGVQDAGIHVVLLPQ
jgi:hypothetical protein